MKSYLDWVVEFIAGKAGYVEKDFTQRIGHKRFGLFEALHKGLVTATW